MPHYVYEHEASDTSTSPGDCPEESEFEVMQSMSDDPLSHCPACGKPVRRALVKPRFITRKGSKRRKAPKRFESGDIDRNLPRHPDGTPFRYTELGDKARKKEAARHLEKSLLKSRPDNPFALEVDVHDT